MISDANKAALEAKYGIPWYRTPEARAFERARNSCVSPRGQHYKVVGALGISFRFETINDFLAEMGLRPSPKHVVERIDRTKNFEKGNVRWTLQIDIVKKSRPMMQMEESFQSTMRRIIERLQREPGHAMLQSKLDYISAGSKRWSAQMFRSALDELVRIGAVEHEKEPVTIRSFDGTQQYRPLWVVRLKGTHGKVVTEPVNTEVKQRERFENEEERMKARIIWRLEREPNRTMNRVRLQDSMNSHRGDSEIFHEVMQELINGGLVECKRETRVRDEYDPHTGGTRKVTRHQNFVRLLNGKGQNNGNSNNSL